MILEINKIKVLKNDTTITIFSCTTKYVGEYCQHRNPCLTGPRCQNGGSCHVRESPGGGTPSFVCSCPVGYTASLCEIRIDNACDSSPCFNNGTCVLKSLHEYTCSCAYGYAGKFFLHLVTVLCKTLFTDSKLISFISSLFIFNSV